MEQFPIVEAEVWRKSELMRMERKENQQKKLKLKLAAILRVLGKRDEEGGDWRDVKSYKSQVNPIDFRRENDNAS